MTLKNKTGLCPILILQGFKMFASKNLLYFCKSRRVEPNNISKNLCKTTFDKGCAKQQHFWFYLFLKGKEKGLKINNLLL